MTAKSKDDIKAFFETGDKPTEAQFVDLIDSYVDKSGPIGNLEALVSGGENGVAAVSGGQTEIYNDVELRNFAGITVFTTAGVEAIAGGSTLTTAQVSSIASQAIVSAFATTAVAVSGESDSTVMSPVLTKNYVLGQIATTAQASAATSETLLMTPSTTKKATEPKAEDFTDLTDVAIAASDIIMFADVTDSNTPRRDTVQGILDLVSVSQGDLNTSTGTFSINMSAGNSEFNPDVGTSDLYISSSDVANPGGSYGFMPECSLTVAGGRAGGWWPFNDATSYGAFLCAYQFDNSSSPITIEGRLRYISASPPFDMGDGEAQGFLFLLVDKAGEVAAHYFADVPPWAYNGPTDIRACKKCPKTGKKYRNTVKNRTLEEILDGVPAECELQEITQEIKNADMDLIPSPFRTRMDGLTSVLVDPMDQRIANLIEHQNAGGGDEIVNAITSRKIYADNEPLVRAGPQGIMQCKLKFK